jgi:predicted  nucleic acid-binding Zn-ribbon protein
LVIGGLAWYAYPILQRHDSSLKELPTLGHTVSTLGDQIKQAGDKMDERMNRWSQTQAADRKSLREEVARTARDLTARIETASQQARDSAQEMLRQVRAEVNEKVDSVATRVATLESSHDTDQKQIAALQEELSRVREQMTEQGTELAKVSRQSQDNSTNEQERIAALKQDQDTARHDIGTIENKLAVEKVSFEASTGHVRELSPGISLTVSGTDTTYRRANGWLWVAADRRNIWLRNVAAQEPLTFYGYRDGQKRELVITNVNKSGVAGYLLLPKEPQSEGRAEAAGQ